MTYTEHQHSEKDNFEIGTVEIDISYEIIFWQEGWKFKASTMCYDIEEAERIYADIENTYDSVVFREIQAYRIVQENNFSKSV